MEPTRRLQDQFELIGMDQRNAGISTAPITNDNWDVYKEDQISLLDHLEVEKLPPCWHVYWGAIHCKPAQSIPKDLSQL